MLNLSLFGQFRAVTNNDYRLTFPSHKSRALFAILATERQRHTRMGLAILLWPESSDNNARNSVRVALYRLRRNLDALLPDLGRDLIDANRIGVRLSDAVSVDVTQFQALYKQTPKALSVAQLETAVALYRGEFLADFPTGISDNFDDWLIINRRQFHLSAMQLFDQLNACYLAQQAYERLVELAERQIQLDPLHEQAHYYLIMGKAHLGESAESLRLYAHYETLLADSLDTPPSERVQALADAVRTGQLVPTSPPKPVAKRLHNLPQTLTSFIPREEEQAFVRELFDVEQARLVTLVGAGGNGKTSMALQEAHALKERFADGVWLVSFAGSQASEFVTLIGDALGIDFHGAVNHEEQLINALRTRDMLLILDNFEDALDSAVTLMTLLKQTLKLKVLCTSREPLEVQGEWIVRLDGLTLPPPDVKDVADYGSVQLFVQRARQINHRFALSAENAPAIAEICRYTGGSPLAIELAAAWMRQQTPAQLLTSLRDSPDLLQTSRRDIPQRQRSMRVVFDQTWSGLEPKVQSVLARLSLFQTYFSADAARHVAQASQFDLALLIDKSLLQSEGDQFRLHPLVRQFSAENLPRQSSSYRAFSHYFLDWAAAQEKGLMGIGGRSVAAEFSRAYDDIIQAWQFAVQAVDIPPLLASYHALICFWRLRGWYSAGINLVQQTLEKIADFPEAATLRGQLLAHLAILFLNSDRYDEALAVSLAAQEQNDPDSKGWVLLYYGSALWQKGERQTAYPIFQRALDTFQAMGDRSGITRTLVQMSIHTTIQCESDRAAAQLERALRLSREAGDAWGEAAVLVRLCILTQRQGDYEACRYWGEQGITLCKKTNDLQTLASMLNVLGQVALFENRLHEAQRLLHQAVEINETLALTLNSLFTNWFLGNTQRKLGRPIEGEHRLRIALATARKLDSAWWESALLLDLAQLELEDGRIFASSKLAQRSYLRAKEAKNMEVVTQAHALLQRDDFTRRTVPAAHALP